MTGRSGTDQVRLRARNQRRGGTFRRAQVPDSTPEHREEARKEAAKHLAETTSRARDKLVARRADYASKAAGAATKERRDYFLAYVARIDAQLAGGGE